MTPPGGVIHLSVYFKSFISADKFDESTLQGMCGVVPVEGIVCHFMTFYDCRNVIAGEDKFVLFS